MSNTFDLLIVFSDGERKSIAGVEKYEIGQDGVFRFVKNGYTSFLPKERITYFGRKFDYDN